MAKKLIGVFETGLGDVDPSEMSDEELDAWADAMWQAIKPAVDKAKEESGNGTS